MNVSGETIKDLITQDNVDSITELLRSGLNPNHEGGWPIRLAARCGLSAIVKVFVQFGANPHLLGESGASTLQLAVFSGKHWDTDNWIFLLSYCDSSQLADGAAVALVFKNILALKKILATRRCNIRIPTSLTGRTLDQLAKEYKLSNWLATPESVQFRIYEANRPTRISSRGIHSRTILHETNRRGTTSPRIASRNNLLNVPRSADDHNNEVPIPQRNTRRQEMIYNSNSPRTSPYISRTSRMDTRASSPHYSDRNLSPSVVRFFNQSVGQSSLSPQRQIITVSSPTTREPSRK